MSLVRVTLLLAVLVVTPVRVWAEDTALYLTLDEAVYAALADNADIHIYDVEHQITAHELPRARAIYDTVLSGEVSYQRDDSDVASAILGTQVIETHYDVAVSKTLPTGTDVALNFKNSRQKTNSSFSTANPAIESLLGLQVTQPLARNFGGLIDRATIRMVRLGIEQHGMMTRDATEAVVATVEEAYWSLVAARHAMEQRGAALEKARTLLAASVDQEDIGLMERADVLDVEMQVAERDDGVLVARHSYFQAMDALKHALNRRADTTILIPSEPLTVIDVNLDRAALLSRALDQRRDYRQLRMELLRQDVAIRMEQNARWPQLDLVASLEANGIDTEYHDAASEVLRGEHPNYYIGLQFSWPFGGGGHATSGEQQALLRKQAALLEFQQLERAIAYDMDAHIRTVTLRRDQVRRREAIVILAQDKLAAEQEQFNVGRSSIQRIIACDQALLEAELAFTQSITVYRQALTRVWRAENSLLGRYADPDIDAGETVDTAEVTP